jgi:DnaK suppressor protein
MSDFKSIIKSEIEKTKKLISEYRELTQPVAPDDAIGRVSRMDAINNKSVTESALRRYEEKLKNLNYMLEKANTPDFGICVSCGTTIPIQRLIVRPESLKCVDCAD